MDWGGDRGDTEFSVVGGQSGALCTGFDNFTEKKIRHGIQELVP